MHSSRSLLEEGASSSHPPCGGRVRCRLYFWACVRFPFLILGGGACTHLPFDMGGFTLHFLVGAAPCADKPEARFHDALLWAARLRSLLGLRWMVLLALVISCPLRPKAEDEQTCEASIEREWPPEFLCYKVGVTSLRLKTVVHEPEQRRAPPKESGKGARPCGKDPQTF